MPHWEVLYDSLGLTVKVHVVVENFQSENDYDSWQLLDEPISYDSFTSLPLLTGMFFEYSLRLDPEMELPIVIVDQCDIQIWGWEPIKFKYKLFAANKV